MATADGNAFFGRPDIRPCAVTVAPTNLADLGGKAFAATNQSKGGRIGVRSGLFPAGAGFPASSERRSMGDCFGVMQRNFRYYGGLTNPLAVTAAPCGCKLCQASALGPNFGADFSARDSSEDECELFDRSHVVALVARLVHAANRDDGMGACGQALLRNLHWVPGAVPQGSARRRLDACK
ncbi:hypothetical protein SBBP1_530002 [Burkholderiales bacterium]|nr:hypothetical protein SBBP1_530002 [Burkholderiales bacterium]